MTTINRTFSIPFDLDRDLHRLVKKRGMSHFVSAALRKSLEEKKKALAQAYAMSNEDEGQDEAQKDWSVTISDGLGVDNEW